MTKNTITIELDAREVSLIGASLLAFMGALSQEDRSPAQDKLIESCNDLAMKFLAQVQPKANEERLNDTQN